MFVCLLNLLYKSRGHTAHTATLIRRLLRCGKQLYLHMYVCLCLPFASPYTANNINIYTNPCMYIYVKVCVLVDWRNA